MTILKYISTKTRRTIKNKRFVFMTMQEHGEGFIKVISLKVFGLFWVKIKEYECIQILKFK